MVKEVSIIIPAFNAEEYIGKCLESVCRQSYDNLQIIVVDDGSCDRTLEIADSFSKKDSRIRGYHKNNGGVSSARNLGLRYAHGDYITFLDADDEMEEDAVAVLVREMEAHEADWVSCQYSRWDEDGNRLEDYNFVVGDRSFASDKDRIEFLLKEYLNYQVGYEVWGKLYRADIIKDNGLLFSEDVHIGEDLAFNIEYLTFAGKLYCISDRCIRYKVRENSAMGRHVGLSDKISEDIHLLKVLRNYYHSEGNDELLNAFTLLFAKMLEHSYLGHDAVEVVQALRNVGDRGFAADWYREFKFIKKEFVSLNPTEVARLKYRYHMYIRASLCGEPIMDSIARFVYNCYRVVRGRGAIERWKMPY